MGRDDLDDLLDQFEDFVVVKHHPQDSLRFLKKMERAHPEYNSELVYRYWKQDEPVPGLNDEVSFNWGKNYHLFLVSGGNPQDIGRSGREMPSMREWSRPRDLRSWITYSHARGYDIKMPISQNGFEESARRGAFLFLHFLCFSFLFLH